VRGKATAAIANPRRGGPGLEPFAFTLIVGFLGTYSSIYIAAPVVLFWSNRSKLAGAD
jgi:preprotein translocase subunit SecF